MGSGMANTIILVVEDEPDVRESVIDLLDILGYKTVSAVNADDALNVLRENSNIDLMLTDIVMPGKINGIELAIQAMKIKKDLKVIYTSGYPEDKISKDMEKDVPEPLLVKPYSMKELDEMLKAVIGS